MPTIQPNKPTYIIEINRQHQYPFKGRKADQFLVKVKSKFQLGKTQNIHWIVSKLVSVQSPHLINIIDVVESYLTNDYTITYQYVPYSSYNVSEHQKIKEYIESLRCKESIQNLFIQLIKKGITPVLNLKNFGFTHQYQLKYYLHPNFTEFPKVKAPQVVEAARNFAKEAYQMLKLSYTPLPPKKDISLTDSLKRLRQNMEKGRMILKETSRSEVRKKSKQSEPLRKPPNLQLTSEQLSSKSGEDEEPQKIDEEIGTARRKRTSSFRQQRSKPEGKVKKASWGEQKTAMDSFRQRQDKSRQQSSSSILHERITQALMKTEQTLQKYEQIKNGPRSPRSPRSPRNSRKSKKHYLPNI